MAASCAGSPSAASKRSIPARFVDGAEANGPDETAGNKAARESTGLSQGAA